MSKLRAMLERHARVVPFAIAAISLLAHVHFIVVARGLNFRYDSHEYIANAKHLAAGDGFLNSAGEIESRRTPAYPFFLSLFYRLGLGVKSISNAQHLIAVALALALYFVMLKLTGDILAAAIAEFCLGIDSGQIYIANQVMTEILASATFLIIVILLLRFAREPRIGTIIATAIVIGIAALERPAAMYLALPLTIWIAIVAKQKRAIFAITFFVVSLILPVAWTWRNYKMTGEATMSVIGTELVYYWRGAGMLAIERTGFEFAPLPFGGEENFRHTFFRIQQKELIARDRAERDRIYGPGAKLTAAQISRIQARLGWDILRHHYPALVPLGINGALHLVFDSTWDYANAVTGALFRDAIDVVLFINAIICFVLALIGCFKLRKVNRAAASLLMTILVYFIIVLAGPEQEQWRYRIPLAPIVSMFIGAAFLDTRRHAELR